MYQLIEKLHVLYGLLMDEQSKDIFLTRFAIDMEQSIPHVKYLVSLGSCKERGFLGWNQKRIDILKKLNREDKKIILYGTARAGHLVADMLELEQVNFYGFCGRDADEFPNGLLGKPVFSPDELVAHGDEYYVVPTVGEQAYEEISNFLQKKNYPEDHILDWIDVSSFDDEKHYFEFPELYHKGTAFIDAGCYDCEDSYRFAKWCGGAYSSIIAFEPDPNNYNECCKKVQDVPLHNFELVKAGLSRQEGIAVFDAQNSTGSCILSDEDNVNQTETSASNKISIRTAAIDDIVGDRTVGFIKMDIEGAEFDALHGAKNTILRDKPLLAICVYHLQGDLFAIMDYLHQLLPEYRFLLRHYSVKDVETVLYASVDL